MTPTLGIYSIIGVVLFLALAILYFWIDDLRRVRWLNNLRPGNYVRFYANGNWREGKIIKKATAGMLVQCDKNGRNYAVPNSNIKKVR